MAHSRWDIFFISGALVISLSLLFLKSAEHLMHHLYLQEYFESNLSYTEKCNASLREGLNKESFIFCEQAAITGDTEANFQLGLSHQMGRGTKKDIQQAIFWYQEAAQRGHLESLTTLASFYKLGIGYEKDEAAAYQLYLIAAQKGEPHAQFALGTIFYLGNYKSFGQDKKKGLYWLNKAAAQGFKPAVKVLHQYGLSSESIDSSQYQSDN